MSQFRYDGEDERVFPALALIVNKGDTFEAPDDFSAYGVSLVSSLNKKNTAPAVDFTTSGLSDTTKGV